jgi:hypothetical protein
MNNNIAEDGTVEPSESQQIMIDAYMEAHPNFKHVGTSSVLMQVVRDWYREHHSVHRKFS